MQTTFGEMRKQIRDIRNFLGPFQSKLASLDQQVAEMGVSIGSVRSTLLAASSRMDDRRLKLAFLLARVELIEMELKIPQRPARKSVWPPENRDLGAQ